MSGFLNKVQLIGNLGRDPEVRSTQSGKKVVTLNIATGESWKDASGNKVERTEWHRVVIWNEGLGDIAEKYLIRTKGSQTRIMRRPPAPLSSRPPRRSAASRASRR